MQIDIFLLHTLNPQMVKKKELKSKFIKLIRLHFIRVMLRVCKNL